MNITLLVSFLFKYLLKFDQNQTAQKTNFMHKDCHLCTNPLLLIYKQFYIFLKILLPLGKANVIRMAINIDLNKKYSM